MHGERISSTSDQHLTFSNPQPVKSI
jgi:hypothetical protein